MGASEVAAGAAWLDENFPGWERKIDLGTFKLSSCQECVLGQALREQARTERKYTGGFDYGYSMRDDKSVDPGDWVIQHGFAASIKDERLWRELIKERFSSGLLSDEK